MHAAIPLSRRSLALWLSAFFGPTLYFLLLLPADTFHVPAPPDALVASLFYLIPSVALLVCGSVIWRSSTTTARRMGWMLFTLLAMLLQVGILLHEGHDRRRENIIKDWNAEVTLWKQRAGRRGYDFMCQKAAILYRLVRNSPTLFYRYEYVRITTAYVDPKNELNTGMDYDHTLLQGIVLNHTRKGELQQLKEVLRVNCPWTVDCLPVEYVVVRDLGPKAFEVFFDGYENARNDGVREHLLEIIASSFKTLHANTSSEAFVPAARTHYARLKERMAINPKYVDQSIARNMNDLLIVRDEK